MNALEYHLRTRHFPNRFAKSLGYLDWENQPSPYKSYFEAEQIPLKKITPPKKTYEKLYLKNDHNPINLETIALMLRYSLAINAKKVYGPSSWYVRVNPSSGNLHPEETYIIFKNGVYHFNVKNFSLELLAKSDKNIIENGFLIILNSIPLRESWKYGERALRYCLLDSGHAIAALRFSTNLLGWNMKKARIEKEYFLSKFNFHQNEEEIFEAAFFVFEDKIPDIDLKILKNLEFKTAYSPLAKEKVRWEIIFESANKLKDETKSEFIKKDISFLPSTFDAYEIIDNRRSALGFKQKYLPKNDFLDILDKTLHRKIPPFDVEITANLIDFLIFVNRVEGIESGIYYFDRKKAKLSLIEKGDFSQSAKFINCVQDLGSDSAFTINMIAPIPTNENYKSIMFESGMIGHILYLEAEAKGVRGCGIGCFFDDLITKEILNDEKKIATYGFSVGVPLIDERIIKI